MSFIWGGKLAGRLSSRKGFGPPGGHGSHLRSITGPLMAGPWRFPQRLMCCLVLLAGLLAGLSGCGGGRTGEAWAGLVSSGETHGFRPVDFSVPPFNLSGLLKGTPGASSELVVYLEGDGRGVIRGRVTPDPTPSRAMGFELARSDPAPAVLYLARIGQFQPAQTGREYQDYWSNRRLAEEAVTAAGLAVDEAKALLGAGRIHLVGYSGGGGLAVLLAERRSDVASLTTVAGLLDTNWWVREKNFQPLTGSLNPADHAARLAGLTQVHFYGREDSIIPPDMSAHFQTLAHFSDFRRVEVDTNHWRAWPEFWPGLMKKYLLPARSRAGRE